MSTGTEWFMNWQIMVSGLGAFPDKYLIQNLTQQVERNKNMATSVVALLEGMLSDPGVQPDRKLPLCYLTDSILKNVKEPFPGLLSRNLLRWFPRAFDAVDAKSKHSMTRVLGTWEQGRLFPTEALAALRAHINGVPAAPAPLPIIGQFSAATAPSLHQHHSQQPPLPPPPPLQQYQQHQQQNVLPPSPPPHDTSLHTSVPPYRTASPLQQQQMRPPDRFASPLQQQQQQPQQYVQPQYTQQQYEQQQQQRRGRSSSGDADSGTAAAAAAAALVHTEFGPLPLPAAAADAVADAEEGAPLTAAPAAAETGGSSKPAKRKRWQQADSSSSDAPVVPGSEAFHAMVDTRMRDLLQLNIKELESAGETSGSDMTIEELWKTDPQLAMEFRSLAESQVQEELRATGTVQPLQGISSFSGGIADQNLDPELHQQLAAAGLGSLLDAQQPSSATTGAKAQDTSDVPTAAAAAPVVIDMEVAKTVAQRLMHDIQLAAAAIAKNDAQVSSLTSAATGTVVTLAKMFGVTAGTAGVKDDGEPQSEASLRDGRKKHALTYPPKQKAWQRSVMNTRYEGPIFDLYDGRPFHCKQDSQRFTTQAELDKHLDLLFQRRRMRREQASISNSSSSGANLLGVTRPWYCTLQQWVTDFGAKKGLATNITGINSDNTVVSGQGHVDGYANSNGSSSAAAGSSAMSSTSSGHRNSSSINYNAFVVAADEEQGRCRLCGEPFDMFYDGDEEEWMFRNACYATLAPRDGTATPTAAATAGAPNTIIVHKLCLDTSGAGEDGVLHSNDLVPSTPGSKRKHDFDAIASIKREHSSSSMLGVSSEDSSGEMLTEPSWAGAIADQQQQEQQQQQGNGPLAKKPKSEAS